MLVGVTTMLHSAVIVPADHPYIQYFGRWDKSDPLHPRHSWPGVYVYLEFTGTSIAIRMADNADYFNVYVDGEFRRVVHGDKSTEETYTLAEGLQPGAHRLLLTKRNFAFGKVFDIAGFVVDDGATLGFPPEPPDRKIEFIGDSFTAAEGNEATKVTMPWEETFPVTNIDLGFAPLVAKHFGAQYHTICRSGSGMVCDWQGNEELAIPRLFDRTLMEEPYPKWDFASWIPELAVICLGLNDHSGLKASGLKDASANVPPEKSAQFRAGYHDFVGLLRLIYPGVKILAVAPHDDWVRANVRQVVKEENAAGYKDVFYTEFDYFEGGYVNNGHPNVATHRKIADQIIEGIEKIGVFK